jgi:hypothetical protein
MAFANAIPAAQRAGIDEYEITLRAVASTPGSETAGPGAGGTPEPPAHDWGSIHSRASRGPLRRCAEYPPPTATESRQSPIVVLRFAASGRGVPSTSRLQRGRQGGRHEPAQRKAAPAPDMKVHCHVPDFEIGSR